MNGEILEELDWVRRRLRRIVRELRHEDTELLHPIREAYEIIETVVKEVGV